MALSGRSWGPAQRGVAIAAVLGVGAWAVSTGLIPIYGGRSAPDAGQAASACFEQLRVKHGRDLVFADDVKINGGDSPDAVVTGTATRADQKMGFVCTAHNEGGKAWQVRSIQTF